MSENTISVKYSTWKIVELVGKTSTKWKKSTKLDIKQCFTVLFHKHCGKRLCNVNFKKSKSFNETLTSFWTFWCTDYPLKWKIVKITRKMCRWSITICSDIIRSCRRQPWKWDVTSVKFVSARICTTGKIWNSFH